jgi:hypothetical protein
MQIDQEWADLHNGHCIVCAANRVKNLEFLITFCETNLRLLTGEPITDEWREREQRNIGAIASAKLELEKFNGVKS